MRGGKFNKKLSKQRKPVRLFKPKVKRRDLFLKERENLIKRYDQIDIESIENFDQLPLTSMTLEGLKKNNYTKLTDIQRESIGLALKGCDILGAAKTGSGKTLAFVIPVLECLFREGWSRPAGLGALVITPTRELAYQIFEVFNKIGPLHEFTVALVIGGKDLAFERKVLNQYNIVICTPGRLLQHMDENPLFDAVNLQILVLDEADKILDLGFAATMNAIIENLPIERQTLLFSATQTKSVKDLARLSLKNPMYVSVHEHSKYVTPESLQQSYLVCEAHEKLDFLWSFLKNHKKQKILVFMASCKQVKYAYESFCHLRPGISVTALYGSLHQLKRMERYNNFCRKEYVVMFATDIAARGLDFPNVNWVIQLDCPEDVNTYIHRAGRTARYQGGGESLLLLLPSEKDSMVEQLQTRRIPINEIRVNTNKLLSISKKLNNFCARDTELTSSAQRAFNSYLKSIFLMKDKTVFDVQKIDAEAYSRSLGLPFTPRTRFIKRCLKSQQKPQNSSDVLIGDAKNANQNVDDGWGHLDDSDEGEDDVLKICKTYIPNEEEEVKEVENVSNENSEKSQKKKPLTKAAVAKQILKQKIKANKKIVFDEEDKPLGNLNASVKNDVTQKVLEEMDNEGYSLEKGRCFMVEQDKFDKELYKQKIKEKHKIERIKQKDRKRRNMPTKQAGDEEKDSEDDFDSLENIARDDYIDELPDPDQFYGTNSAEDDESIAEESVTVSPSKDSTSDHINESHKRKKKLKDSGRKRAKLSTKVPDTIGPSYALDEEDFALQLLQNS